MAIYRTADEWKKIIKEQRASDKSVKLFCIERGIHVNHYYRKRREIESTGYFVQLPQKIICTEGISIYLDNYRIELGTGWDPDELKRVLITVKEACDADLPG